MAELPDDVHVDIVAKVNFLVRPISMARIQTIDWDELRELADVADRARQATGTGGGAYAMGVRDALRWLATGEPTVPLLDVLSES